MQPSEIAGAFRRLTGGGGRPEIVPAVAAVVDAEGAGAGGVGAEGAGAQGAGAEGAGAEGQRLLDALTVLRWARSELATLEPELITAARAAGVSWQALAPALGVASRQAAERRYLRLIPATADQQGSTRDGRVRAERDRRAGHRAVAQWAKDNTADLRRLAGQVTALTDLGESAAADIGRLYRALGEPDASALPGLLTGTQRHLAGHPDLAGQIDTVAERTDQVRRQTQRRREGAAQDVGEDDAAAR